MDIHEPHNNRQPGSRVPARQLDDGPAGLDSPLGLRILDNLPGNAVFLRKARIQVVELGEYAALQAPRDPRELDKRGLADGLDTKTECGLVSSSALKMPPSSRGWRRHCFLCRRHRSQT